MISRTLVQGAQGAAAQESGESDELSGITQVNALAYEIVFPDARVILTDGTVSQNDESTTMVRDI
jgi:hypothetical protein